MWDFQANRNRLRDRMLIAAPEANPHQFVQRVLLARGRAPGPAQPEQPGPTQPEQSVLKSRIAKARAVIGQMRVPASQF